MAGWGFGLATPLRALLNRGLKKRVVMVAALRPLPSASGQLGSSGKCISFGFPPGHSLQPLGLDACGLPRSGPGHKESPALGGEPETEAKPLPAICARTLSAG